MRRIYLMAVIVLTHMVCPGQTKHLEKNEMVAKTLVGSWKFDYAIYSFISGGVTVKEKEEIFHTDTLHFFEDMTFRFTSHDREYTDGRIHTGRWEVADNGRILSYRQREAMPPFPGHTPDVTFPLRVINKNRIRINYTVTDSRDETRTITNNTPVFFDRIK